MARDPRSQNDDYAAQAMSQGVNRSLTLGSPSAGTTVSLRAPFGLAYGLLCGALGRAFATRGRAGRSSVLQGREPRGQERIQRLNCNQTFDQRSRNKRREFARPRGKHRRTCTPGCDMVERFLLHFYAVSARPEQNLRPGLCGAHS